MRKHIASARFAYFLAVMLLLVTASGGNAQEAQPWSQNTSPLPAPTGFVNDYAGVIDAATKQQLETRLKTFKETSEKHVEIAVAVVRTTGDRAIFDYSLAVARGWKIGSKQDDNPSALLFIAVDDRKYFTQVSKDLEDELPDGVVGSLQRQFLVPEFRKGNYAKGVSDTVEAYIKTIESKSTSTAAPAAPTEAAPATEEGSGGLPFGLICCGVIGIVILIMIFSRSSNKPNKGDRDRWGGGGFGGGGSGGSGDSSALPWIIGGILGGLSSGGSSSSSSSDWGGSSGGGSDWGGFGGGGDFGGGGAGGDW